MVESDTLKLEENPMGKVEVVATSIDDEIHQLLHVRIVALQIEGNKLRNVELQVLPNRSCQIRIDTALG